MKNPIHQIAADIVKQHGSAMTAQQIYQTMVEGNLYEFKAKNPLTVVLSQLRRHSKNHDSKNKVGDGIFIMHEDGKFELS